MANWDMTPNAPPVGGDYIITITKPGGCVRVADTAIADTSIPPKTFDIHYVTGSGPGSSARDENWLLGRTRGTSPDGRIVTVRAFLDGVQKKKIKPTIMDSNGGGKPTKERS